MISLFLRSFLLPYRKSFFFWITLGNIFFVCLALVEPVFFREIIDILVGFEKTDSADFSLLHSPLLFWMLLGFILIAVRGVVSLVSDRFAHQENARFRQKFFEHVLHLSLKFHSGTHSGKTLKKFNRGLDAIFWTHLSFLRVVSPNILMLIFLVPTVLFLNWRLGLILIGFLFLFLLVAIPTIRYTNKRQGAIESLHSEENARVGDAFANISVVKSFTRIAFELNEIQKLDRKILKKQMPILNWWAFIVTLYRIAHTIIFLGIFFAGSLLYVHGLSSIGDIVMFVGFAALLLASLETIMWEFNNLFWKFHPLKEFYELLDTKADIVDCVDAKKMSRISGRVEFENVTFAHDGEIVNPRLKSGGFSRGKMGQVPLLDSKKNRKNENITPALKNISFVANPGEVVALVGHTGSGKSTTANLISRFFEPQQGKIFLDEYEVRDVTQDSLRSQVGMVFQENLLFHDTILNNIKIGNPKATEKEVVSAAKKANAWDFIKKLPKGLKTVVGERGVKLSGGEKQRVAIARAILKNPPVLVLDEATSALDAITEQNLQEALAELMKGRTTFVIAHRLSTIRKADQILVFEQGKIIERGKYSDLLKKKGKFSELVDAQVSGFVL